MLVLQDRPDKNERQNIIKSLKQPLLLLFLSSQFNFNHNQKRVGIRLCIKFQYLSIKKMMSFISIIISHLVPKYHANTMYRDSGGKSQCILNSVLRGEWLVSFMLKHLQLQDRRHCADSVGLLFIFSLFNNAFQ
jgi:hypothetical protein